MFVNFGGRLLRCNHTTYVDREDMVRVVQEVHGDQTTPSGLLVARQLGEAVVWEEGGGLWFRKQRGLGRRRNSAVAVAACQTDPLKHLSLPFSHPLGLMAGDLCCCNGWMDGWMNKQQQQ